MSDVSFSLKNIKKRAEFIQNLSAKAAEVGVLENSRGVSRKGKVSKLGAAEIAAIQCKGTIDSGHWIPPRDYQTNAFVENKVKYKKIIKKAIANGIESSNVFMVVGQIAVADQKLAIRKITPRNAPSTIKAKGKDSPLIDTGHLLKSLTYKVVDSGN